jgi:hypothetical protein
VLPLAAPSPACATLFGMNAVPRDEVYRTYWTFAVERQRIFMRRLAGESQPWTDDPILQSYKFCNAFRASDRVSQFLIRYVIYDGRERSPEDVLLRIVLFRLFSKPATWRALETALGDVSASTFDEERTGAVLDGLYARGESLYTGAFILCANKAYGHARKHRNHLALVRALLASGLSSVLARARGLRDVYEAFLAFPLLGPFMAYQLAIDINYSELTDFSEDEFTVPGPGAERGFRKCFKSLGSANPAAIIDWMVENQERECERLGLEPPALFGRRLHAIDCQSLFCEVDKYSRVAFPELKSDRTRIKAAFVPTPEPLPLFYSPKWGLNERLPLSMRTTAPVAEQLAVA